MHGDSRIDFLLFSIEYIGADNSRRIRLKFLNPRQHV